MKRTAKWLAAALALCLLATPVLASSRTVNAILTYRDISIAVDGEELAMTDVNGNDVEPLIIDDTTYVPVRGFLEAVNYTVDWNDSTNVISVESRPDADRDGLGRPGTWMYVDVQASFVADEPVARYTASFSMADAFQAIGEDVALALQNGESTMTYYEDGIKLGWTADANEDHFGFTSLYAEENRTNTAASLGGPGRVSEIYVDEYSNVTLVIKNTYLAQVSSDYDAANGTLSITMLAGGDKGTLVTNAVGGTVTVSSKNFSNLSTLSNGDYVLVNVDGSGIAGDAETQSAVITAISAAETVTGTVSAYTQAEAGSSGADKANITVNGTTYRYGYSKILISSLVPRQSTFEIGAEATLVLDAYNNVIAVFQGE